MVQNKLLNRHSNLVGSSKRASLRTSKNAQKDIGEVQEHRELSLTLGKHEKMRKIETRVGRMADNNNRLLQMRNRGAAPAQLGKSTFESLWMMITNRRPSTRFRPMLDDLQRIYIDYNEAQARYVPYPTTLG